jgi:hypothetical protein
MSEPVGTIDLTCESCHAPAASAKARFCVYCENRSDDVDMMMRMAGEEPIDVSEKLAAGLLSERPLGNSAEKRMLAAGHPASWPSIGDDEP